MIITGWAFKNDFVTGICASIERPLRRTLQVLYSLQQITRSRIRYLALRMLQQKFFTKEDALQKIKHYAAYQERCHSEVKEKLYSFNLRKTDVEEIISTLISENYLNEERFAIQYAGGKFRIKQWGRIKIKYALKQKQVSDYSIKKALNQIDDSQYIDTLNKLAEQKLRTLKSEKNIFIKKRKMQDFLMQKGFENDLIKDVLNKL